MSDQDILKTAIQKAEKNGYQPYYRMYNAVNSGIAIAGLDDLPPYYMNIIFNHDFAKAFFPQPENSVEMRFASSIVASQKKSLVGWENHLQIMVLEVDPIKYLEQFL